MKIEKLKIPSSSGSATPSSYDGKVIGVLIEKVGQIIDTINKQEGNIYHLKEGQTVLRAELYKLDKKIDFIMENSRFTEPPSFISKKTLKELYK